jgi:hypothetical protein
LFHICLQDSIPYGTVTVTVCEPHDENVTLPLTFLTVIVKLVEFVPVTLTEAGDTCIWPLLLEVAVMVALPLLLLRCALTVTEPFSAIVIEVGLTEIEHGTGVGVDAGVGDAEGVGVGDEEGVGVGDAEGVGVGDAEGVGDGVADAEGDGDGDGDDEGVGVGDAERSGVGVGSGITPPPEPVRTTSGIQASKNRSDSKVTSPEPVIATLTDPGSSFANLTFVSTGIRPRQSKLIVNGMLMVTPVSVKRFWVVTVPEPLKSIVTA